MDGGVFIPSTGLGAVVGAVVKANIRQLLVDAVHDKLGHAYAVASGRTYFREVFVKQMGGFFGKNKGKADDLADMCWGFLQEQWNKKYPGVSVSAFLDAVSIKSPPTEQEIEDAWEIEIASDEASMRENYEGSARTRKGSWLGGKGSGTGWTH